jgi:N-acetylmuramoyl-L-alanine amidase
MHVQKLASTQNGKKLFGYSSIATIFLFYLFLTSCSHQIENKQGVAQQSSNKENSLVESQRPQDSISYEQALKESEALGALALAEGSTIRGVVYAMQAGEKSEQAFRSAHTFVPSIAASTGASIDDKIIDNTAQKSLLWYARAFQTNAIRNHSLPTAQPSDALAIDAFQSDTVQEICRAAILKALLEGDLAHDPRVSYKQLYIAQRVLEKQSCVKSVEQALQRIAHFRPSIEELEALDLLLIREGFALSMQTIKPSIKSKKRAKITRISKWSIEQSARVVIEFDQVVRHEMASMTLHETQLRFEDVDNPLEIQVESGNGLLQSGSISAYKNDANTGSALSLLLAKPAYRRVFFLPDPYRIVVDLSTKPPEIAPKIGPRPLRRLVLDAGHGGADPGAIGPSGLREKDVTLSIAKQVAPILARELGITVRLTRADDTHVSLEERAAAANAFDADLFLSIHCNAAETRVKRGIEFYVLDTENSDIAHRVAKRENGGGSAAPGQLRAILDDLKLHELADRSRRFAHLLQKSFMASLHDTHDAQANDVMGADAGFKPVLRKGYPDMSDGGVHGAGFFVLVGAKMPAALIELAFISNPIEEGYLREAAFRSRSVDAIVNALKAYKNGS